MFSFKAEQFNSARVLCFFFPLIVYFTKLELFEDGRHPSERNKAKVSNRKTCWWVVLLPGPPQQLFPPYVRWPCLRGSCSTYGKDHWAGRKRKLAPETGCSEGCSRPEAAWVALFCMQSKKNSSLVVGGKALFQRVPSSDRKGSVCWPKGFEQCQLSGFFWQYKQNNEHSMRFT